MTKVLLRNQSFSATPLFGKVFNSTMAAIFGDVVYRVPKGFDKTVSLFTILNLVIKSNE